MPSYKPYSHSRIEAFVNCPFKFKCKYIDKIELIQGDEANNPLILGKAIHEGIENGVESGLKAYYKSFPVITDLQINEAMKLENLIEKSRKVLPKNLKHEVLIENEDFKGFIDGLEELEDGTYNIYDFKYSNNQEYYMQSPQLHLYKYYFENITGKKVNKLFYLFIPKTFIRQKKSEDLYQFRKRLENTLKEMQPELKEVIYDETHILDYKKHIIELENTTDFEKEACGKCEYCTCFKKGYDYMILPSSERRTLDKVTKKKIWVYGEAFTGKTSMLDKAPNPLNLNTDGNIQFVTMPYIPLKDEVTVTGRITNRKFAWEVFKDTISELEKKQNDFKTIIVDLVEDTREMCRLYEYDKLGIEHESDSGYGKGWDIIKTEYLSTIKRLFNLDYENIIIVSHEVSSEVKKKSGQTITKIYPNIQEALANKLAGMVDIVARAVVEEDGTRTLNFKSNEFIFGGGRLKGLKKTTIPLDWEELMKLYDETIQQSSPSKPKEKKVETGEETLAKLEEEALNEEIEKAFSENESENETEKPKKRARRTRKVEEETDGPVWTPGGGEDEHELVEPVKVEEATEEKPKRTRRTRKAREE